MRATTILMTAVLTSLAVPAMAKDHDRGDDRQGQYDDGDRHGDRHDNGNHYGQRKHDDRRSNDYQAGAYWQNGRSYDWNRPDPRANGYYADRYYRDGSNYQPRYLGANDRVYRGNDNRYYCRRSDGTTGLIIGAIGGGVLGNAIAPGDSRTVGTLAGGVLGALLGRSIDRGNQRVQCR